MTLGRTPVPPIDRFRPKWKLSTEHEYDGEPCWEWIAGKTRKGYGTFRNGKMRFAHRFAWEQANGPIPDGWEIDHKCRVRHCVNVEHLQCVEPGFNGRQGGLISGPINGPKVGAIRAAQQRAKTHCPQGHPYAGGNLYVVPATGSRQCITCNRERMRRAA